ncbi:nuclear RNA export factor 1 isoform X1 [Stomoxys calcitrans]|uniref:nuclear RNA export factor 1 isoform X1 n=1 Tax=Stomoxys calcitrans TaxID=35570 RepID=UPI0027E23F59|nr:nuclear RNA export factor 1 isoform X1 [Stomoxys calcitrans]
MPKPRGPRPNYNNTASGGSGSRFSALNDYQNEHDDRNNDGRKKERNTTRRVSFKPSAFQNKGAIKGRVNELALRTRLEDDEDMDGLVTTLNYEDRSQGSRRKGSPIPKGKFGRGRKLSPSQFGWYQVTIYFNLQIQAGQRYSKDDLIRALLNSLSPDIFIPLYWRTEKNCVVFFVDDFAIALRLTQLERNVQMSDGYRLFIRVRDGYPLVSVDEPFKEKMKLAMAKRYNAHTKALDLTKFHADPDFRQIFVGLFRNPVLSAALDIIQKNIPDLEALNLNDNNLNSLESFKSIETRLPHLKILYLGGNNIASLAHLLVLRNVPIIDLVLKNNPLRQRYKDHALYVSEVRRKFPKLVKLDGEDLEPQILFDVNDTSTMPKAQASFLCDASGADIIRQFLEQYFMIFDSDNRQPLLDAYHEQAMMSMSVPPASQAGRLNAFWKYNRNFRRIVNNDDVSRLRQLKVGRLPVVSNLAEWPKTQHDPQSFTVDLTLFTPKLISFTVAGLFKELESTTSTNGDIRYFQRQFVIVPAGGGFCIRNEMIFVTSATGQQARTFLKTPSVQASAAGTASNLPTTAAGSLQSRLQMQQPSTSAAALMSTPAPVPTQPDDATKMQMIQAMIAQSNMNMEWSRKCLEETNWDYNHAAFVFDKLNREGKIPPEAFIK